jgi:hypothetical protein
LRLELLASLEERLMREAADRDYRGAATRGGRVLSAGDVLT